MSRSHRFHALAVATTLQLSLLAGCATPVAIGPTATPSAGPAAEATPPAAAPEGPSAEAPAAPAATTTLSGLATFRGEPLAGYALTVQDAQTGERVPLAADLAGATGLTIADRGLVTDAAGRFTLQVAHFGPGRALRVVAHSGVGALETLVTGTGKALGTAPAAPGQEPAAQRRVLAGEPVPVNELTTALARIARGAVANASLLTPAAAGSAMDLAFGELDTIAPPLRAALGGSPATANRLVETRDPARPSPEDAAEVTNLVRAANVIREVTALVANRLGAIARQAEAPGTAAAIDAARQASLDRLPLAGTVLQSGLDAQGRLTLTNTLTHQVLNASAQDLSGVTATVTASSGSSAPAPAPTLTALSQARGSVGTIITLTGTNFSATAAHNVVKFGTVTALTPVSASATTLRVAVPAGLAASATPVTVTVETAGRATGTGQPFEVVARGTLLKDLTIGGTPHSLAFDSADNLYVALWGAATVKRYRDGVENGSYATAPHPYSLVVDRQGVAWVATDTNITRIVNGVPAEAVAGFHGHMAVDADNHVWSGKTNTRTVSKLRWNADTETVEAASVDIPGLPLGATGNWTGIAVSGTAVWVGAQNRSQIFRVDTAEAPVSFGSTVAHMVTGLDGTIWAAGLGTFKLAPLNGTAFGAAIPLTDWAHGLAVGKDGAIWSAQRYANAIGRSVPGPSTESFGGFSQASAVAVDSAGNIWATTISDGRLVQLAP
ncbi:MAG: IPT/TIG domain-containing protein [Candidatus Sericytochromatia bacterium]